MTETVSISRRFRGPHASGNGGYACGLLAGFVGGEAEVTLRLPPPLDRPLRIERDAERVLLLDGEALVAEAVPARVDIVAPAIVTWEEAVQARERYTGFEYHPFPECFTCGPSREQGDGLCIYPGEVRPGLVAAPWAAHDVSVAVSCEQR